MSYPELRAALKAQARVTNPNGRNPIAQDVRKFVQEESVKAAPSMLAKIDAQHALIEQMREALKNALRWFPVYPAAADVIVGGREAHAAAYQAANAAYQAAKAQQ